jgi:lipase maturation factor 1
MYFFFPVKYAHITGLEMDGLLLAPDSYVMTRWVFLRLLGLIYLIAFSSLGIQVTGLIGEQGVLPVRPYLERIKKSLGRQGYALYPSLAWLACGDTALLGMCLAGSVLALLLLFGVGTTPVLVLLWGLYLSLVVVGQVFLLFQWDVLLLEAGFISIFLVPPSLLPVQALAPPSPLVVFLMVWLLFRLVFLSGALKLLSDDPTWHGLTAMQYHYETQPLPVPLAWYMHKAPVWFQKLSTLFTLVVETAVPLLFLLPDPLRQVGAALTVLLQLLILLTGNFAFFNWLTIFLTIFLLHDAILSRLLPAGVLALVPSAPTHAAPAWGLVVPLILLAFYLLMSAAFFLLRMDWGVKLLRRLEPVIEYTQAWRLVNSYGLFVSMTTVHPEIILEGSDDGTTWMPYEFKYKIGNPQRPLPTVAPHQPRLDWQMWFAALRSYPDMPWFLHLIERLLEGSRPVLGLLERNPFPEHAPRYIRAMLYDYKFTSFSERSASGGAPWKRELLGVYMAEASLRETSEASRR